jgi:chorismate lyase/3-hydroxybenzoate synthase
MRLWAEKSADQCIIRRPPQSRAAIPPMSSVVIPSPISEPLPLPESIGIGYERRDAQTLLAQPDVLAVLGFGAGADLPEGDPRVLRVGLEPLAAAPFEVWRGSGPVRSGREGDLRWSSDGDHLFFALEIDEAAAGGITAAAERAYRAMSAFITTSATPHLLRLWNYLDAINLGDGDDERYRLFCDGRVRGLDALTGTPYPAATAIGRQDGVRVLQVYGLAGRQPGKPVENPRQVSAWRYPRRYGPTAPTFARGMLDARGQLLISGTAAVVGHASQHSDDLDAQIEETLANLDSLTGEAGMARFGAHSLLKAYVREPADADVVAATLAARIPALGGLLLLAGDVCRRELLVEVDGVQRRAG